MIVLTLCVISSPIFPSPLVAAVINRPFWYFKLTLKPSIFSSHTYLGLFTSFLILVSKFNISSSLKTLERLIIGMLCFTLLNLSTTSPPIFLVGESFLARVGYLFSKSINSLRYLSYSISSMVGLART